MPQIHGSDHPRYKHGRYGKYPDDFVGPLPRGGRPDGTRNKPAVLKPYRQTEEPLTPLKRHALHARLAAQILAGLLANPALVKCYDDITAQRGDAKDLVDLADDLAGVVMARTVRWK